MVMSIELMRSCDIEVLKIFLNDDFLNRPRYCANISGLDFSPLHIRSISYAVFGTSDGSAADADADAKMGGADGPICDRGLFAAFFDVEEEDDDLVKYPLGDDAVDDVVDDGDRDGEEEVEEVGDSIGLVGVVVLELELDADTGDDDDDDDDDECGGGIGTSSGALDIFLDVTAFIMPSLSGVDEEEVDEEADDVRDDGDADTGEDDGDLRDFNICSAASLSFPICLSSGFNLLDWLKSSIASAKLSTPPIAFLATPLL